MTRCVSFTEKEIDDLMQTGGPLLAWDGDEPLDDVVYPDAVGGWRLRLIKTNTQGTRGKLIALATDSRTARIFKFAKTQELLGYGATQDIASRYVTRSRQVKYAMEEPVMRWVIEQYHRMSVEHFYDIANHRHRCTRTKELGYRMDFSSQRLEAGLIMLSRLWNIPWNPEQMSA